MKRIALVTVTCLLAAGVALAGSYPLGVRAGISSTPDQFFLGGHAEAYEFSPGVMLVPNVEIGFGDDVTLVCVNGGVRYSFLETEFNRFVPYAGAELGFNYISWDVPAGYGIDDSETKLVVNLMGGVQKKLDAKKSLLLELKLGLSDYAPDLKLTAGLTFF